MPPSSTKPSPTPAASIVIAGVGDRRSTEAALAAAERASAGGGYEIVVAGVGDADLVDTIRRRFPEVVVVVPATPLSAEDAWKRGAAVARGKRVLGIERGRVVPARWVEGPTTPTPAARGFSPRRWWDRWRDRRRTADRPVGGAPAEHSRQHAAMAWACMKQGDDHGAILRFREALAAGPRPPHVVEGLASVLLRQERLDEAEALFREVVDRHPPRMEGHRGVARVREARQDWRGAHDAWATVAGTSPDSPESLVGMANAAVRLGRFEEGEALLVEASRRWPDSLSPATGLAAAATQARSFRLAQERWTRILDRAPENLIVRGHCVLSLLAVVDVEGARRVFEAAPRDSWTARYLGVDAEIRAATYDWPAVLEIADTIGRSWPHDLDARLLEADWLVRVWHYLADPLLLERAAALCATLVGRHPHSLKARVALAKACVQSSRNTEALHLIERLPDNLPHHSGVMTLKAWQRSHGGDVEGAKRAWRGLESGTHHPALHGPPGTFRHLDGRAADPVAGEVLLFTVIRNEARHLPWFLDHYRRIGVRRFYVIDNGSTDGGDEFLLAQDDVHVFRTTDSYAASWSGMRWINHFVERFGVGHWCLYVDVDEMLVVPGVEDHGLSPLLRRMERRGDEVCRGFMIDMHGPTVGHRAEFRPGDDPLALLPLFRAAYRCDAAVECPYWSWSGGVRGPSGSIFHLTKTPIVRGGAVRFLSSSHQTTPAAVSDTSAALLHFKLAGAPVRWTEAEIGDRLPGCVRRHLYGSIAQGGDGEDVSLVDAFTMEYESSRQLVSLGLIECPPDFFADVAGAPGKGEP